MAEVLRYFGFPHSSFSALPMPVSLELGPLSFPSSVLLTLVAVFVGAWLGCWLARRLQTAPVEPLFWRIVFWALVVSRGR